MSEMETVGSIRVGNRKGRMFRRLAARFAPIRAPTRVLRCAAAPKPPPVSAVNVEEFTLNPEVVERDMAAAKRWMALGESLTAHKKANDNAAIVDTIQSGFALLKELGEDAAPVNCEPMLLMELALAELNDGRAKEALAAAEKARALHEAVKPSPDEAQLGEIREFCAFATLASGEALAAKEQFDALINWIDVGSSKAMPMVRVAA